MTLWTSAFAANCATSAKARPRRAARVARRARRPAEQIHIPAPIRSGIYSWLAADTGLIPRAIIRAFCAAVAREFQPERIVLFGSYAYGKPTSDSDGDLMVIMPGNESRRVQRQSLAIRQRLSAPFPLDVLVRSAGFIAERLRERDMFIELVMTRGKIMYEC